MMDDLTQIMIDNAFEVVADREKVNKIDALMKKIGFENDFFSFSSFLAANQNRLVCILDYYFYKLLGEQWNPTNDFGGGLVSYMLYDAATPFIDDVPYDIKNKKEFEEYVTLSLERIKG